MQNENKNKIQGISIILAFFSLFGIKGMMRLVNQLDEFSNSVFSVIVFFALFGLYYSVLIKHISRRLIVISLLLGTFFAISMHFGVSLMLYNTTSVNSVNTWIGILESVPLFAAIIAYLFETILPKLNSFTLSNNLDNILEKLYIPKIKNFILIWLLIVLAWVPGLIASYPGIYGYDAVFQMNYYVTGKIVLQHPIIHTYLLGFCIQTIGEWLGSKELGLLVYSIIQMLILSGAFAFTIFEMSKRNVSVFIRTFFILIFMFFPVNSLMSFSTTKDIIYAATFLILLLMMYKLVNQIELEKNNKFLIGFIFVAFFNMIFRSQGIYVFTFSMIIGLFIFKKHWKKILLLLFVPLVMFKIYSGPITTALHGVKFDSLHEMMSVPVVQLSRTLVYRESDLTKKEKKEIVEYIPNYQTYSMNNEGISDAMKNSFNSKLFKENPSRFIKLWFQLGLKEPVSYIDAFGRLTIGLWYPDMNYRDPDAYHPYWEYNSTEKSNQFDIHWVIVKRETPKFMKWLSNYYSNLTYNNSYQNKPLISMFYSSGLMVWLMFIYVGWCFYQKKYKMLFPASLVVALWLTLLLGPVVLYRYIYPISISIPVMFSFAISESDKERTNNDIRILTKKSVN